MKKTTLGLLSVVAAAAFAAPAHAQLPNFTPFSLEVRGGLAFPSGDFGETAEDVGEVESGYTVGANATYHFMPLLGIYAGYTYNRFGVEGLDELDVNDHGFNAGLRLAVPTPLLPIDPYVKGGVVYNKLGFTFDGDDEDFVDSDSSLGFEVGAGIGIGLGPKLSFTPQVTYTRYEPKYDGESDDFTVQHLRADVGLRIRL
ncbi:MAG TPA: outer membrane beta-barrel protein [Longimicrobiaceae bacterium]|jgi:opacity protein-like surface antigen